MYSILKGCNEKSILSYYNNKNRGLMPHPASITRLCILGGVKGTWEEEERCPKASPLTLIGIAKPPTNKDKKNMQESDEEERDNRENK